MPSGYPGTAAPKPLTISNARKQLEKRLANNRCRDWDLRSARQAASVAYQLGGLSSLLTFTAVRVLEGHWHTFEEALELKEIHDLGLRAGYYELLKEERENPPPSFEERHRASHQRIVERCLKEQKERERRHLERCAVRPTTVQPIRSEVKVIRPNAPVVDGVPIPPIAEVEEPITTIPFPSKPEAPQPKVSRHCGAKPIGELGRRLSSDIDWILKLHDCHSDESNWPPMAEFDWEGLDWLLNQIRSGSTPEAPRGSPTSTVSNAGPGAEEAEAVADEVVGALPQHAAADPSEMLEQSAWDELVGSSSHDAPSDITELVQCLDSADTRAAVALSALERSRLTLLKHPGSTPIDRMVEIPIADLVVLVRTALLRLR